MTREINEVLLVAMVLLCASVLLRSTSGCEGEVISRPDDLFAPAPSGNLVHLTWDPNDTGWTYMGYEVCWSKFRGALGFNGWNVTHVGYDEFRRDVFCVSLPDSQRATVEFPDGHWYAAVRAVYVNNNPASDGVFKTQFSNVIEVSTQPQIHASPIEEVP